MNYFYPFLNIVLATVFFIVATIVGGALVAEADSQRKFDWDILKASLIKYGIILLMAILMYIGGYFGDEILKDYTTEYVNLKSLVSLGLATYAINRAADATKHWVTIMKINLKKDEE